MASTMFYQIKISILFLCLLCNAAFANDFKVGRYATTPENGWNANAYWLESDEGIVLIDGLLLIEDAKLWATMLKSLNKPVKGLIITHYHHDHTGGINTLLEELGPFPIYSSRGTSDTHIESNKFSYEFTVNLYGDRFDKTLIKPDQIIEGKKKITIAGIDIVIDDVGPGESMNATVIYQPDLKILFSGDAIVHNTIPYTTEGRSMAMLNQLKYLKEEYKTSTLVYPGHGDPASIDYVDYQISYIMHSQKLAKELISKNTYRNKTTKNFIPEVIDKYSKIIMQKFPHLSAYGFPALEMTSQNFQGILKEFE